MAVLKTLLLILIAVIPLGEVLRFEPIQGIAIKPIDAVMGLLLITWVIAKIRKRSMQKTELFLPLSLFVGSMLLSLIVNISHLSISESLISFAYLIRWVSYALLFFIVRPMGQNFKRKVIIVFFISGGVTLFFGFIQFIFYNNLRNLYYLGWDDHLYRMFSTFLDPNFAGCFFALYFFFVTGLFIRSYIKKQYVYAFSYSIILFLTTLAIFLTYSRSALIMFLVGAVSLLVLYNRKRWIAVLLILFLVIFIFLSKYFYIENMNLLRSASSMARVQSAETALQIFQKNPVLGIGFDAYRYAQVKYGFRKQYAPVFSHADAGTDNSFLFVISTTGIIGGISYLFLNYRILQYIINAYVVNNKKNTLPGIILVSFIGILIDSLFNNSLFYPTFMLWFWIFLGIIDYR